MASERPALGFAAKVAVVLLVLIAFNLVVIGLTALVTTTSHYSSGPPPAPLSSAPR